MKCIQFIKIYLSLFLSFGVLSAGDIKGKTIVFKSLDGLTITADLYITHNDKNTPFIVLFHQAGCDTFF